MTPAMRREYRSLREDGGYSAAEARAWVLGFPPPDAPEAPPCPRSVGCRCADHQQAKLDEGDDDAR